MFFILPLQSTIAGCLITTTTGFPSTISHAFILPMMITILQLLQTQFWIRIRIPNSPDNHFSFHQPPQPKNPNPVLFSKNQKSKRNTQRANRSGTPNHSTLHQSQTTTIFILHHLNSKNPNFKTRNRINREIVNRTNNLNRNPMFGIHQNPQFRFKPKKPTFWLWPTWNTINPRKTVGGSIKKVKTEENLRTGTVGSRNEKDNRIRVCRNWGLLKN